MDLINYFVVAIVAMAISRYYTFRIFSLKVGPYVAIGYGKLSSRDRWWQRAWNSIRSK